jgi:hypothetical protein
MTALSGCAPSRSEKPTKACSLLIPRELHSATHNKPVSSPIGALRRNTRMKIIVITSPDRLQPNALKTSPIKRTEMSDKPVRLRCWFTEQSSRSRVGKAFELGWTIQRAPLKIQRIGAQNHRLSWHSHFCVSVHYENNVACTYRCGVNRSCPPRRRSTL